MQIYGKTPKLESEQTIKERRIKIGRELHFIAEQKKKLSAALDSGNKSESIFIMNVIDYTLTRITHLLE